MRTTVTLDSDVEAILRSRMAFKNVSFKQALNDSVRDGSVGRAALNFTQPTFELGLTVDATKATQLAADLDDARIAAKLSANS